MYGLMGCSGKKLELPRTDRAIPCDITAENKHFRLKFG